MAQAPFPVGWMRILKHGPAEGVLRGPWRSAEGLREGFRKRRIVPFGGVVSAFGLRIHVGSPLVRSYQVEDLLDGSHEAGEVVLVERHLDPRLATVELGGSIGVLACLTNRMLRDPARHVVVEANPLVTPILRRNRDLNDCEFEILHAAVAYGGPTVEFAVGADCMTGAARPDAGGERVRVPSLSLRRIVEARGFGPINLIVDIEGGEVELVRNELDVLKDHVKVFILETHERMLGGDSTRRMIEDLERAGFRIVEGDRDAPFVFAFVNEAFVPTRAPAFV